MSDGLAPSNIGTSRSWPHTGDRNMPLLEEFMIDRRALIVAGTVAAIVGAAEWPTAGFAAPPIPRSEGDTILNFIKTADGVPIFYKDLRSCNASPLVFHPDCPLTPDHWDNHLPSLLS